MNIVYLTNTFTPHIGSVASSIEAVSSELRARGHRVVVVAPEFPDMPMDENGTMRIPAVQNFNASDFSVGLAVPEELSDKLSSFGADIIHSHHPYLLGMTAIRLARSLDLPLLFTHHTLYEQCDGYCAPGNGSIAKLIVELATAYANLTDSVIAPSDSLKRTLLQRGVSKPISVVPTGVRTDDFFDSNGAAFRQLYGIAEVAFIVGHMGRLVPEKNIGFLARSVGEFLERNSSAVFLLVGDGPCLQEIKDFFSERQLLDRLVVTGDLEGEALSSALQAMDVFAFSSKNETQAIAITAAMAAGAPVVALDGPGVRDVVIDDYNGFLLPEASEQEFLAALTAIRALPRQARKQFSACARATAAQFSLSQAAENLEGLYRSLRRNSEPRLTTDGPLGLEQIMARLKAEWDIVRSHTHAGIEAR